VILSYTPRPGIMFNPRPMQPYLVR
jgi:hypothetical protein